MFGECKYTRDSSRYSVQDWVDCNFQKENTVAKNYVSRLFLNTLTQGLEQASFSLKPQDLILFFAKRWLRVV